MWCRQLIALKSKPEVLRNITTAAGWLPQPSHMHEGEWQRLTQCKSHVGCYLRKSMIASRHWQCLSVGHKLSDLEQLRDPALIFSHVLHIEALPKVTRVGSNHGSS